MAHLLAMFLAMFSLHHAQPQVVCVYPYHHISSDIYCGNVPSVKAKN